MSKSRAKMMNPLFRNGFGWMTVVRGEAPAVDLSVVLRDALEAGDTGLEVGVTFIGASTLNGAPQHNNFAVRCAVVDSLWRFDVGLGLGYLQNTDVYNGSNLNFNLLLGYRFSRIPVTVRAMHFSNGGTRSPNKGRDMLLVYWRF